jgi:hypothetical protein
VDRRNLRRPGTASLITAMMILIASTVAACGDDNGDDTRAGDTTEASEAPTTERQGTTSTTEAPGAEPTVVTAAGDITAKVDEYRELLGPDNGGGPGQQSSGRREIDWDAVPDEQSSPNPLPSDFFNSAEEPRARGVVLETDGEHVAVSADSDNPSSAPVRFGDINASYVDTFRVFSEERLFSPVGSNVVDLRFYLSGTSTPAASRGFGAVYTDVDAETSASFEFYDSNDGSIGQFSVPVSEDGLSFLGIAFEEPIVARVRIVYGNSELGPNDDEQYDVAVMDDFIYGEPQPL